MQRRQHAVERGAPASVDLDHVRIVRPVAQPRQRTQALQDLLIERPLDHRERAVGLRAGPGEQEARGQRAVALLQRRLQPLRPHGLDDAERKMPDRTWRLTGTHHGDGARLPGREPRRAMGIVLLLAADPGRRPVAPQQQTARIAADALDQHGGIVVGRHDLRGDEGRGNGGRTLAVRLAPLVMASSPAPRRRAGVPARSTSSSRRIGRAPPTCRSGLAHRRQPQHQRLAPSGRDAHDHAGAAHRRDACQH